MATAGVRLRARAAAPRCRTLPSLLTFPWCVSDALLFGDVVCATCYATTCACLPATFCASSPAWEEHPGCRNLSSTVAFYPFLLRARLYRVLRGVAWYRRCVRVWAQDRQRTAGMFLSAALRAILYLHCPTPHAPCPYAAPYTCFWHCCGSDACGDMGGGAGQRAAQRLARAFCAGSRSLPVPSLLPSPGHCRCLPLVACGVARCGTLARLCSVGCS